MRKRYPPDDPREWLNRARSDLVLARLEKEGIYLEDMCFHTQQAAEKAIKALLINRHVEFPYSRYCPVADFTGKSWSGDP
jgi:HEPN domain-containing protein